MPDKRVHHGHARDNGLRTITYNSWANMVKRCTNPKQPKYPVYGGRGIVVCDRWRHFENFLADMGERPPGKSLDRFPNNDGNYEPSNCRWATSKQQHETQRHRGGAKKGEMAGERNGMCELTEREVLDIRARFPLTHRTGPRSAHDKTVILTLCADHAISPALARRIAARERWKHI